MLNNKREDFMKELIRLGHNYIEEKFLSKEGFDDVVYENMRLFFWRIVGVYVIFHVFIKGFKRVRGSRIYNKFDRIEKEKFDFIVEDFSKFGVILDYALKQSYDVAEHFD